MTTLGDLADIGTGATPKKSNARYYSGGSIPWVTSSAVNKERVTEADTCITDVALRETNCRVYPPGTLLIAMYGEGKTRGKVAELSIPAATNQALAAAQLRTDQISRDYIRLFLTSRYLHIRADAAGGVQPNLNLDLVRRLEVPLAPATEQCRIIAKLDSLRARSGRARHELDRVPKLIERYKQAILAKAFSGELTKEWRKKLSKRDTGEALLRRIDQARSKLIHGTSPSRRGPIADGEAGRVPVEFLEMPVTWDASTLENITNPTRLIQYGILKPGEDHPGGVPYVKVMNIRDGEIQLDKIRRTTPAIHAQYRRSSIAEGDILLSIRGTVGRLGFVPKMLHGGNITQDSVRIDVLPQMNPRFVYWYLHSPAAQAYFSVNQKGVAVRGINVGDVRPMEIPVPPEAEQSQIVTLIDHAMLWLDKIATEHDRAEHLLPKLDQAILAKAFRGELVPQDPNDEPASTLLERIKSERQQPSAGKRRPRAHP